VEINSGSWQLFTGLVKQHGWPWFRLIHASYVDHLQFIKNKAHGDSLKILLKLDTKLGLKEIT
jgi:hypothetical protein